MFSSARQRVFNRNFKLCPSLSARTAVQAQNYSFHLDCCYLSLSQHVQYQLLLSTKLTFLRLFVQFFAIFPILVTTCFMPPVHQTNPSFLLQALITVVSPSLSDLASPCFVILTFVSLQDTSFKH